MWAIPGWACGPNPPKGGSPPACTLARRLPEQTQHNALRARSSDHSWEAHDKRNECLADVPCPCLCAAQREDRDGLGQDTRAASTQAMPDDTQTASRCLKRKRVPAAPARNRKLQDDHVSFASESHLTSTSSASRQDTWSESLSCLLYLSSSCARL